MGTKCTEKIFIPIMVVIIWSFISGCQISETPEEILENVDQLLDDKKNEAAVAILRPFIYHHQDNYKAHFFMGQAFLNAGAENDKSLYIARYYFDKARDLAENEMQREKAALMYADVKMLMGKGNQSAEVLLETAARAGDLGRRSQAVRLCIQAGSQFIEAGEYENAQEACQIGLKYAETDNQQFDLRVGLATVFFLEKDYTRSNEILQTLPANSNLNLHITALDHSFLDCAVKLMILKSEKHLIMRWKKEFDAETRKKFVFNFNSMAKYLEKNGSILDNTKARLVAETCQIVAEHAEDHHMLQQARKAYRFANSFFGAAGLEKEARAAAKEIDDLDS